MNEPGPLPQADTIKMLLDRSGRHAVPIRRSFLEVREPTGGTYPGPMAAIIRRHDDRALELFLLAHAVTSSSKNSGGFDVTEWATTWGRALGLYHPASGLSAISRVWHRLEADGLITRSRGTKRRTKVTVLREDGTGATYTKPAGGSRDPYLNLPHEYWLGGWHQKLALPAKAVLLISLSRDRTFYLPHDQAADWYGLARDTIRTGLNDLQDHKLLELVGTRYIPSLASPTGWTPRNYYELRGPYRKPDKDNRPNIGENIAS